MVYQSLYRRYRPGKFSEIAGQSHVIAAVRNAVRDNRVGHAYLFSGPRGTGKTTTARVMAKALNCTNLSPEGEPCNECESCQAFLAGTSYDLHELDAASNNGVEAVRDLISKVALGSPGRTKVYILDEVHMLTSGAENALLKTLEEPPDHVKFVLATTEPHKVVSTIRSRTQHLHFELMSAEVVTEYVRWVIEDAGLDVDDEAVAYVVRAGGGSMRDTLSALDQVVAAGGVPGEADAVDGIVAAIASSDSATAMTSVEAALKAGRDPRTIGEATLGYLRDGFLASIGADLGHLTEGDRERATGIAGTAGAARLTRAMEAIGSALVDMRQAPDPRVDLEVALLRLTSPELATDMASVVARLDRLEAGGIPAAAPVADPAQPRSVGETESQPAPAPTESKKSVAATGAAQARAALEQAASAPAAEQAAVEPKSTDQPTLGALRKKANTDEPPPATAELAPEPDPEPQATKPAPAKTSGPVDVISVWESEIRPKLSKRARPRLMAGTFESAPGVEPVLMGLPNEIHKERCDELRPEVEGVLAEHFGRRVVFEFVVSGNSSPAVSSSPAPAEAAPAPAAEDEESIDIADTEKVDDAGHTGVEALTNMFPGSEVVEPDPKK